ncbi:glucokinase [Reinekea sp.]|jgi:glucokinase|uniref:glucokinase n=1 Tax=Reinekea sp. TaxID=1970455 RepID=UPI003989BBDA
MTQYGLIADIGGTNARFALAPIKQFETPDALMLSEQELIAPLALNGADYNSILEAAEAYLESIAADYPRPDHAVMAIACPTDKDQITMTNHTWSFSVSELKASLGLVSLKFINDYNAMANAIPHMGEKELVKVGGGAAVKGMPIAVTGPGTGLGLAALAFSDLGPLTLETEGGHAHFAPTTAAEIDILKYLLTKYSRVSNERLISGMGLENIYQGLCSSKGLPVVELSAPEISKAALDKTDSVAEEALATFCAITGNYAGDVALTIGAKGGVYITGGIVPRFIEYFKNSQFRACFENKARMSGFVVTIPTYVVMAKQPGLLGAAAVLNHRIHNKQYASLT